MPIPMAGLQRMGVEAWADYARPRVQQKGELEDSFFVASSVTLGFSSTAGASASLLQTPKRYRSQRKSKQRQPHPSDAEAQGFQVSSPSSSFPSATFSCCSLAAHQTCKITGVIR